MRRQWLGDGWEPQVVEENGEYFYSVPVESGFVSRDFTFTVSQADLQVLLADGYRRAALEVVGHAVLQQTMVRGHAPLSQEQFAALCMALLHAAPHEVEATIDGADVDHNMATRRYIRDLMQRYEHEAQ